MESGASRTQAAKWILDWHNQDIKEQRDLVDLGRQFRFPHGTIGAMKYYKINSRKISFGEYWHISSGSGFLIGWLGKLLGIPISFSKGIPEPQPFRENIIEANAIPPGVLKKLNSAVLDFRQLGFNQFWFYTLKNSLMAGSAYGVQALHSSHRTMGKIIYVSFKTRESFVLGFLCELNDGTIFGSANRKQDFNNPPNFIVQRLPGANASQLWELHQKTLAGFDHNNPPKIIAGFDQVAAFEDKTARLNHEVKIGRGILVEMTEAEVAALRTNKPPPVPS
jgi:hypothetical protein